MHACLHPKVPKASCKKPGEAGSLEGLMDICRNARAQVLDRVKQGCRNARKLRS
jgi:hypothetical protein